MQIDGKSLVIRADANTEIGVGHLMRCLALAQAWQNQGGRVTFVTGCKHKGLLKFLLEAGSEIMSIPQSYPHPLDLQITLEVLAKYPSSWLVLDGYHFDTEYHRHITLSTYPLLVIDDMAHLNHYCAAIILNQNIYAPNLQYSCEPSTNLLLGSDYVMLRSEFLGRPRRQRIITDRAQKVLVTLGGGDPDNQTLKVLQALQLVETDRLEVCVLVGANNPHLSRLQSAISNLRWPVHIIHNATNMPELMAWADVAISAGGSTCWEMAFMGLPNLILVVAENQRKIAVSIEQFGAGLNLGWFEQVEIQDIAAALSKLLIDRSRRQQISDRGQILIDGLGCKRIISALQMTFIKN